MSGGLIIDSFAGGGGASLGIEMALGRSPNIAINHDPEAIAMHRINHPDTRHFCESVWDVKPKEVCTGRSVDLLWASPDCKHFSKAKGARPVEKRIRGLAWVVLRWIKAVRPTVVCLENVEEFKTWGPLVDGKPCPKRKGLTFLAFVKAIRRHGYDVDWRELKACEFGAPTIRKRLFMVARCDGRPISWPEPTHGPEPWLKPYRTAAECIDWAIPCPSIFTRKKPLAENTMKRIANGIRRFILADPNPFIIGAGGREGQSPPRSVNKPMRVITAKNDKWVIAPYVVKHYGGVTGVRIDNPLPTTTASGAQNQLVTAFLGKHFGTTTGQDVNGPISTLTGKAKHSLMTSHLIKMRGTSRHGQSLRQPMATVTAGGLHIGEVRAFLTRYNGCGTGQSLKAPMLTVTSKERLGLVTVAGQDYAIADIGMRMLSPRELFRAQGFPDSYIIDLEVNGRKLPKTAQVRMVGNSVCPPAAEALVRANCSDMILEAAA